MCLFLSQASNPYTVTEHNKSENLLSITSKADYILIQSKLPDWMNMPETKETGPKKILTVWRESP